MFIGERPAIPIYDKEIENSIKEENANLYIDFVRSSDAESKFLNRYTDWLFQDRDYAIKGMGSFSKYATNGTTQGFHDFYSIHRGKTLVLRKGEYPYHVDLFEGLNHSWRRYKEGNLKENDFVILSYPFSGNGSSKFDGIFLDECEKKQIPVLLDCAMWGLTAPMDLDLNLFSCIKMVTFSASKFFNIGHMRVGMTLSKYKKGSLQILNH